MRRPGVARLPGAAGRISRRPSPPLDACAGGEAGAWLHGEVIHGAGLASPAGRVHGRGGRGVHGRGGVGTCTGRGGGWGGDRVDGKAALQGGGGVMEGRAPLPGGGGIVEAAELACARDWNRFGAGLIRMQ